MTLLISLVLVCIFITAVYFFIALYINDKLETVLESVYTICLVFILWAASIYGIIYWTKPIIERQYIEKSEIYIQDNKVKIIYNNQEYIHHLNKE